MKGGLGGLTFRVKTTMYVKDSEAEARSGHLKREEIHGRSRLRKPHSRAGSAYLIGTGNRERASESGVVSYPLAVVEPSDGHALVYVCMYVHVGCLTAVPPKDPFATHARLHKTKRGPLKLRENDHKGTHACCCCYRTSRHCYYPM